MCYSLSFGTIPLDGEGFTLPFPMRLSEDIIIHPVSHGCLCFTSIFVLLFQADELQVRSLLCLFNMPKQTIVTCTDHQCDVMS